MAASIGDVFFKVGVNTAQFKQGLNTSVKSLRAWKAQAAKITRGAETPIDKYNRKFKETHALFATGQIKVNAYRHEVKALQRTYFQQTAAANAAAAGTGKFAVATKAAASSVAVLKGSLVGLMGPLALVFGTFKTLKMGEDIERTMRNSMTVFRGISEEMKKEMRSLANEIAGETLFSTNELAGAFFFLGSAGLDAKQSLMSLRTVAQFAQAGLFDLGKATQLATTVQKSLGLRVKDPVKNLANLRRVTDALVGANTVASATVEEFAESLSGKLGAALRQTNKPIEEAVGLMGALADAGLRGKEAMSAAAIIMRGLQIKAVENGVAFKDMKVDVFDANGEMRHMADITSDLEKALSRLAPKQQIAAIKTLGFTQKNVDFIRILLGTSDAMREYESRVRAMGDITGDVAGEQMTDFQKGWEAIKAAFDNFALTFGPLMDTIGQTMLAFSEVLLALTGNIDTWGERIEQAAKGGLKFLKILFKLSEVGGGGLVGLAGAKIFGDDIREFIKDTEMELEIRGKMRQLIKDTANATKEVGKKVVGDVAGNAAKGLADETDAVKALMSQVAKLREETINYGKTRDQIFLEKLFFSDVSDNVVRQAINDIRLKKERAATDKLIKDAAKFKSSADRLKESMRTPQQVFDDDVAQYKLMLERKLLSELQFIEAVRRARKRMIDPKESTTGRSNVTPALERFSQAAHRVIVGSTTSPEIQNQKKMITELKDGNGVAGDILDELKNRPAIGVAPGVN